MFKSNSIRRAIFHIFLFFICSDIVFAENDTKSSKSEISDTDIKQMLQHTESLAGEYQLGLSLSKNNQTVILKPNVSNIIKLDLQSNGFKGEFDIYALVLMSEGNRLVAERVSKDIKESKSNIRSLNFGMGKLQYSEFGTLSNKIGVPVLKIGYVSLEDMNLKLVGSVGSGAISTLGISQSNYPVNFTLPFETLGNIFITLFKDQIDDKAMSEMNIKNEKFPIIINLAYLGSITAGNDILDDIVINITPTTSLFFYDGIMIAPAVIKRYSNGMNVLLFDDKRVNRLIIPCEPPPNTTRPKVSISKNEINKPQEVNGELKIFVIGDSSLTIGRKSTIDFKVEYNKLKPSSEIYVVLQPANGNEIIQIEENKKVTSTTKSVVVTLCKDPKLDSGTMQIQESGIVISAPLIGKLEAGRLNTVEKGGNGSVLGKITFTPPPFNDYYDRIRATPMALSWSDDGRLCTVFDTVNSNYTEIKIKGR